MNAPRDQIPGLDEPIPEITREQAAACEAIARRHAVDDAEYEWFHSVLLGDDEE